jgi:hypothetical protein
MWICFYSHFYSCSWGGVTRKTSFENNFADLIIVKPVLDDVTTEILAQKQEVARLKDVADKHPFYKYNGLWTRELQNLVCSKAPEL